jgi:hypothetical protein
MPLKNADLEEEKEVELYTIPFVDNLDNPVGSSVKRTPIKMKRSVMEAPQPVDPVPKSLHIDCHGLLQSN